MRNARGNIEEVAAKRTFHLRSVRGSSDYQRVTVIAWREREGRNRIDAPCAAMADPAFREANPNAAALFALHDLGLDEMRDHELMALARGERTHLYRGTIDPALVEAAQAFVGDARKRAGQLRARGLAAPMDACGLGDGIHAWKDRLLLEAVKGAVDASARAVVETVLKPYLRMRISGSLGVLEEPGDHIELGTRRCRIAVGLDVLRVLEGAGVVFRLREPSVTRMIVETEVEFTLNGRTLAETARTRVGDPSPAIALVATWHGRHARGPRSADETRAELADGYRIFGEEEPAAADLDRETAETLAWMEADRERLVAFLGQDLFERIMEVEPREGEHART